MKRPSTLEPLTSCAAPVVVTGTGFSALEKAWAEGLCQQFGATYDGNLSAHSTKYLVCRSILLAANSQKFHAALKWNIQVVSWQWLVDSAAAGNPLAPSAYKTDPALPFPLPSGAPTAAAQPMMQPRLQVSSTHGTHRLAQQSSHHSAPHRPVAQATKPFTKPVHASDTPATPHGSTSQGFSFPTLSKASGEQLLRPCNSSHTALPAPASHGLHAHRQRPTRTEPAQRVAEPLAGRSQGTKQPAARQPACPVISLSSDEDEDAFVIPGTQVCDDDEDDEHEVTTPECLMTYLAARKAAGLNGSNSGAAPAGAAVSGNQHSGLAASSRGPSQSLHHPLKPDCSMATSPASTSRQQVPGRDSQQAASDNARCAAQPAGSTAGGAVERAAARLCDQMAGQLSIQGLSPLVAAQAPRLDDATDMLISPAPGHRPGCKVVGAAPAAAQPAIKLELDGHEQLGPVRSVSSLSGSSGAPSDPAHPAGGMPPHCPAAVGSSGSVGISTTSAGMPASDSHVTKRRPRVCMSTGFTPCSGEPSLLGEHSTDCRSVCDQAAGQADSWIGSHGNLSAVQASSPGSSAGAASSGPSQHLVARGGVPIVSLHAPGLRVCNLVQSQAHLPQIKLEAAATPLGVRTWDVGEMDQGESMQA